MPVAIENKTDQRVLLRFNSGLTRYLAPREVLRGVEHVEVKANARIRHLVELRWVALDPPVGGAPAGAAAARRRSREMRAEEAIEHIRRTPLEELGDFLSPDEDRVTVLRALDEKREE